MKLFHSVFPLQGLPSIPLVQQLSSLVSDERTQAFVADLLSDCVIAHDDRVCGVVSVSVVGRMDEF
jgi:hypothetical protein